MAFQKQEIMLKCLVLKPPIRRTNRKLMGKTTHFKIHNVEAFPQSIIQGINRVVKLLIVINGEVIQSFKHFKLLQSASRHHTFSLMLPHDAVQEAESYQLEFVQKF